MTPFLAEAQLVYAFDTLGYSKRLRDAGVPQPQAEAHAEAAQEFIMAELVTKVDIQMLKTDIQMVKSDIQMVKTDIQMLSTHFDVKLGNMDMKLDNLSLRLTVRLGIMLVAGISILAAVIKLQ
jgi:hypothetical protein